MHYLMNKNIIWGIVLILILSFVFGMLFNLKNAYAYNNTLFDYVLNDYSQSEYDNFISKCQDLIDETGKVGFCIDGSSIILTNGSRKITFYTSGTYGGTESYVYYYNIHGEFNTNDEIYDVPNQIAESLGLQFYYFSEINNTVSIINEITTGMTPTEFKVIHEGLGYVQDISFELFNYQGDLISVTVPEHNTDYTIIDVPPGEQPYYMNFVKNPLETTVFYFYTPQPDLTFTLPQLNLYTGQAYKVYAPSSFSTIEFSNQKPTQVYIYRENKDDPDDFLIENINPTANKTGLNSTSFINLYTTDNTYFVVIDSDFTSHAVDLTGISPDKVLEVSDIPYVPSNIGEIWESIEPTAPPLVITDIPIDTSIESLDTTKDELIYENKSNQSIDVHLHPSVNSNHFIIKQEKRINPNTSEIYWVDVTNPTKYAERSLKVYPNQRLVVQIFNGTFDFEYPIEYLDGSEILSYTHGVDYSVVVNYGVYGSDPQATDGTGIVNNIGSAITYPDYPDIVENNTVVNDDYSYTNPYELPDFSLPSPLELYNSTKNILVSAVNYMGQFQVIYNMMPAPFPAIVHMVIGSLGVMLFIKIVS